MIFQYELVTHIFQYLDLKSLCRCAQVNKRWSEIARDAALYTNLSLKVSSNQTNNEE